jgi:RNA recognition motif-containing protein
LEVLRAKKIYSLVRPSYAYVDFATPEAKKAAIAMSELNLFGRRLLIKDGQRASDIVYLCDAYMYYLCIGGDFTGRPALPGTETAAANGSEPPKTHSKTAQKILRAQKQPPAPTLFLGNLGFETTDQSIRELFEAHRPVKKKAKAVDGEAEEKPEADKEKWIRKVRMGTFEDSGLCKGYVYFACFCPRHQLTALRFAFVDFTSIEHATSVLVNPKNHLLNRADPRGRIRLSGRRSSWRAQSEA